MEHIVFIAALVAFIVLIYFVLPKLIAKSVECFVMWRAAKQHGITIAEARRRFIIKASDSR